MDAKEGTSVVLGAHQAPMLGVEHDAFERYVWSFIACNG
jgi:hypothetical protein